MINRDNWKVLKAYLKYRSEVDHLTDGSVYLEKRCLRHLLEWADEVPFAKAYTIKPRFPDYLQDARRDGKEEPLSREYLRKTTGFTRNFMHWLSIHKSGYKGKFPAWVDTLKPPKRVQSQSEHEAVTLDEIHAIAKAPANTLKDRRIRAAAVFWFLSGIRVGAFVTLPLCAVDLAACTIKQWPSLGVHTKFSKSATTHLLNIPELLDVVREWDSEVRSVLPDTGYWFAPIDADSGEIDTAAVEVGKHRYAKARKDLLDWLARVYLPYHSPHKFRHGNAVYALKQCVTMADYKAVSQNLMHETIATTDSIYAILSNDDVAERISQLGKAKQQTQGFDIEELARKIAAYMP